MYVVYSAAAAGFSEALYEAAYVAGVRNLLSAPWQAGQRPRRLLFTSSTSVYAQHQGEWVDEDSPAEAESFSGRCIRPANNCCGIAPGRRWRSGSAAFTVPAAPD
jgi:nucleoside-diphosphate-sugar epimerase